MFTGIVESLGVIRDIKEIGTNIRLTIESDISSELKIDQSVMHDGVCLTVVELSDNRHSVDCIQETLDKTALGSCKTGAQINLERSLKFEGRIDGHIVQGHVDETVECVRVEDRNGSYRIAFKIPRKSAALLIPQGSICLNGISLTVSSLTDTEFTVDIIPYTWSFTNLSNVAIGDKMNVEYDILGKYMQRRLEMYG